MTHANAPLTPEGRRRLAHLVVEDLSCTVLGWLVFHLTRDTLVPWGL